MPRGDKHGGRREGAGRPKVFYTIKMPIALTPTLVDWLNTQRATVDYNSDLGKAIDHLIAALWTEENKESK